MKILIDRSIEANSNYGEPAVQKKKACWGPTTQELPVHGYIRKEPDENSERQRQIDAIYTITKLIISGQLKAYTSREISFESHRAKGNFGTYNALKKCNIIRCDDPLDRSKFHGTVNGSEYASKGGKKDRKAGKPVRITQISFFRFLNELEHPSELIKLRKSIGLTDFEVESLKEIYWYKEVCKRSGSSENYPDIYYVWTAERNGIDVFLTLDKKLVNIFTGIKNEKRCKLTINTEVMLPLQLLERLGVERVDKIPLEYDTFYEMYREIEF